MSTVALPVARAAPRALRHAAWPRGLLVVALTGVAYHHSLRASLSDVGSDTPLAYVGLVPLLAVAVAVVKARPRPGEGRLPHPQADWLVGLPLLAVAGLVATALPGRVSYEFWTNRLDLLGLPFFVAGLVALTLGGRVLYRVRLPVAALALAWPLPYAAVAARVVDLANAVTLAGVGSVAPALGWAVRGPGTTFTVGGDFVVNVAPACAGANGVLGFLLVGGAVVSVAGGPGRRKAAWLLTGAAAQLAVNLVRVLAVFAAGAGWGERAAVDWLHPYLGLALFTLSVAVLVSWLPRFGVTVRLPARAPGPAVAAAPRRLAVAASVACAVALAAPNAALARFDPYAGLGDAAVYRAAGAGAGVPAVAGWPGRHVATIRWARPYFGDRSVWERLAYTRGDAAPLYVDAVRTQDLGAFTRYGLRACYRFHDYAVTTLPRVAVGAPAPAQSLAFADGTGRDWAVVSWVWPVGDGWFERVTVLAGYDGSGPSREEARTAAVTFARALVAARRA